MKRYIYAVVRDFKEEPTNLRHRAACDPKTPPTILTQLSDDYDAEVKMEVLINPNTPVEVREAMIAANPALETNISVYFYTEDTEFPLDEFEAQLAFALSDSEFGGYYKSFDCKADDKYQAVKMDSGKIVDFYDLHVYFRPIPNFGIVKEQIYSILDDVIATFGGHLKMTSFYYEYGNWIGRR